MPSPFDFAGKRLCVGCDRLKDKTEFQKHSNNNLSEQCKVCLDGKKVIKHDQALQKAKKEVFRSITAAMNSRKRIEVPHTSELAAELVERHGGVGGLADFIYTQGMTAAGEKPGSRLALEYSKLLTGLIIKSTDQRQTAPDVANLSDEEVERQIEQHMRMLIESHPDVVSRVIETSHRVLEPVDAQEEPAGESE